MALTVHTAIDFTRPPQPGDEATIKGHPTLPLFRNGEEAGLVTICAHCGGMRTVIMLVRDRWYCSQCRAEGHAKDAKAFPISWHNKGGK